MTVDVYIHHLKTLLPNDPHIEQYAEYLSLLSQWAKVYNLTTVTDPYDMVVKHIMDSLSVSPYLEGKRFIDVGTGAGLPGMILAIAHPEQEWILLDAVQKKTHFLQAAKAKLKLSNVLVVHARVEQYQADPLCDAVITRAFSDLSTMLECTQHLCKHTGVFLAMKGRYPEEELATIPDAFRVKAIVPLQVAGLTAQRQLLVIERQIV